MCRRELGQGSRWPLLTPDQTRVPGGSLAGPEAAVPMAFLGWGAPSYPQCPSSHPQSLSPVPALSLHVLIEARGP